MKHYNLKIKLEKHLMGRINLLDVLHVDVFQQFFPAILLKVGRGNATLTMVFVRVFMLLFCPPCPQNSTRYITQVFVKTFSSKKSTII